MEGLAQSPATMALLLANLIVTMAGFANKQIFDENVFWIGPMREQKQWYRALSSGFLHINPPHFILNMYALIMFGVVLEAALGIRAFLLIYFAALLGGSVWSYKDNRNNYEYRAAGASGAISGVVAAYCLYAPMAELKIFGFPMPAFIFAAGFIGLSYYLSKQKGGIIGHSAHLGGAIIGIAMAAFVRPNSLGNFMNQMTGLLG